MISRLAALTDQAIAQCALIWLPKSE